jgi:hypothetical protein
MQPLFSNFDKVKMHSSRCKKQFFLGEWNSRRSMDTYNNNGPSICATFAQLSFVLAENSFIIREIPIIIGIHRPT